MLREKFTEAVFMAGSAWYSYNLWRFFIVFETMCGNIGKVCDVYRDLISIPSSAQLKHLHDFEVFLNKYIPDIKNESMEEAIEIVNNLKEERNVRITFEESVKEELEDKVPKKEIVIWKEYLEHMHSTASDAEVRALHERCLSRCFNVEELWLLRIQWEETKGVTDNLSIVLKAGMTMLPANQSICFKSADFKEKQGDFQEAHKILKHFADLFPNSSATMRRVNIEQRRGDERKVNVLFQQAYNEMEDVSEASEIALKFSLYSRLKGHLQNAAEIILAGAITNDDTNEKLYMAQIDIFKILKPCKVLEICDQALASNMNREYKCKFAKEKVTMTEALGLDLEMLESSKVALNNLESVKKKHFKLHREDNFECDECNENFKSKKTLKNHKSVLHSSHQVCPKCAQICDDKKAFKMHYKQCEWRCDVCSFATKRRWDLTQHHKSHKAKVVQVEENNNRKQM